LQAGFAEVVVTPPLGVAMAGYFEERLAEGIRDNLYSRALVISQGETHMALVVADLISVPSSAVQAVKERVEARLGIPGSHILIAATHTHTGPVTDRPSSGGGGYMDHWAHLTAGAIELAFRRRVPVTLGVGRGSLPGVAFNRRFRMKNGYVHTNPGVGNPDVTQPAGAVDPDVTVLRFDGQDGVPIGILTHFACHCDTVGGNHFSADWIGVAAQAIRHLVQPVTNRPLGVLVVNGACGDINHINVHDPSRRQRWPRSTEEIGLGLAGETAKVAVSLHPVACDQVGAASTEITLKRVPMAEFLAQSQRALDDPQVGRMEQRRAAANLDCAELHRADPPSFRQEVICLRIGPVLITSGPGEMLCELGLRFKQAFPTAFGMVANLSNGALGYIPTLSAYQEGGYEPRSSRLEPGSGEDIIDAGIRLAGELLSGGAAHVG
jgi:neutral ceramidase